MSTRGVRIEEGWIQEGLEVNRDENWREMRNEEGWEMKRDMSKRGERNEEGWEITRDE